MPPTALSARLENLLHDLERHDGDGDNEHRRLLRETLRLMRDDLRQRDEEHRRTHDRFRLAVDAAKLGIWDWDLVTGHVAWNSHHAQIFGLDPSQFEGDYGAFMRCVHPDDQADLAAAITAARGPGLHFDHTYRVLLPDNTVRWVRSQGGYHCDADGRPVRMTGTVADVSDQIRGKLLAESELRYRTLHRRLAALMDALPVGVSFSEDATCEHITANRQGKAMFEASAGENLSASAADPNAHGRRIRFFHAGKLVSDRELPLQRAVAENRDIPPMEFEVLLPSGRRWYTDMSGAPIRDEAGNVISGVSVMVDVSERKRTEEELRLGRAQMEIVVKGASVGVWYCPLPFDRLIWDATVKQHFHLPPDAEVTIDIFYERIHPEDRERTRSAIETSIRQRKPYDIDYRTVSPDGRRVHWIRASGRGFYDDAGNPTRFDGITIDVTARKRGEEEIRIERERLALALKSGQMGVYDLDLINDRLWWSPELYSVFGVSPASFIPTRDAFNALVHPDDLAELWSRLNGAIAERRRFAHEFRTLHPDGSIHWIVNRGETEYNADGQAVRHFGIAMDISEAKRVERELQAAKQTAEQARAQAEAASKAKDHFLAVLSHELRTPLTPVLTAAEILIADPAFPDGHRDTLQMIRRNVELEARLIDDLLDITRISHHKLALRPESIDLHQKILHVINICRQDAAEKSIAVETDFAAGTPHLRADPARFQQILWNLLKNAIKFTPAGGRVTLRTESPTPGRIRITVADTGVGIDAAALPRIFDAFEQGGRAITREFGGLGLGLAISRALVELHGGAISAATSRMRSRRVRPGTYSMTR